MPPAPLRKAFIHPVKMDLGRDFQPKTYTDQDHLAGAEAQRNSLQATKVLEELEDINQEPPLRCRCQLQPQPLELDQEPTFREFGVQSSPVPASGSPPLCAPGTGRTQVPIH